MSVFAACEGVVPLRPILAPWTAPLLAHARLAPLLEVHGSPVNLHHTAPFEATMAAYRRLGVERGLSVAPYFARKACKALCYVEAARDHGFGIDAASLAEVRQALDAGVAPERITCTAAVKPPALMRLCVGAGVPLMLDNDDEIALARAVAADLGRPAEVGLRVSGFPHAGGVLHSRFGVPVEEVAERISILAADPLLALGGLHFHLGGYDAGHRVSALSALLDVLEPLEHRLSYIDMGGGIPMRYLEEPEAWDRFHDRHALALTGEAPPVTYRNHPLGRRVEGGNVTGMVDAYPTGQTRIAADWLADVLDAETPAGGIAGRLRALGLALRLEPGRSALDGCGMSVARVVHRKRDSEGNWVIGVEMNRTQFRTGFAEVMFDPLLVPGPDRPNATGPIEGCLTGTYCTESELLSLRLLRFPEGVAVGDLVVFPNTAGYLMHFLESRSHQFDLARNLVIAEDGAVRLDAIDKG